MLLTAQQIHWQTFCLTRYLIQFQKINKQFDDCTISDFNFHFLIPLSRCRKFSCAMFSLLALKLNWERSWWHHESDGKLRAMRWRHLRKISKHQNSTHAKSVKLFLCAHLKLWIIFFNQLLLFDFLKDLRMITSQGWKFPASVVIVDKLTFSAMFRSLNIYLFFYTRHAHLSIQSKYLEIMLCATLNFLRVS